MNKRSDTTKYQQRAATWFVTLRDHLCQIFEALEHEATTEDTIAPASSEKTRHFIRQPWHRDQLEASTGQKQSASANTLTDMPDNGGVMTVMQGRLFEKIGVNVSVVHGHLDPKFAAEIPGTDQDSSFWASGISVVAHPYSPHVPTVHMNCRMLVTQKTWFGGGADLTPTDKQSAHTRQDSQDWHQAWEKLCSGHRHADYQAFKDWCQRYFYLPHRNEERGVGGIFFDQMANDWEKDFCFIQDLGRTFASLYPTIVKRRMHQSFNRADKHAQLHRRGRYVEFNLLHDRGTRFGLMTGGNTQAILMSLPPLASWP